MTAKKKLEAIDPFGLLKKKYLAELRKVEREAIRKQNRECGITARYKHGRTIYTTKTYTILQHVPEDLWLEFLSVNNNNGAYAAAVLTNILKVYIRYYEAKGFIWKFRNRHQQSLRELWREILYADTDEIMQEIYEKEAKNAQTDKDTQETLPEV